MNLENRWVRIHSSRPHREQYNGTTGQVQKQVSDLVYVVIGRNTPCFLLHEVEPILAPDQKVQA